MLDNSIRTVEESAASPGGVTTVKEPTSFGSLALLAAVALLFFTFTEVHYDVTQSLGTAFYAEQLGSLPGNLTRSWDHRGYAHKLVSYLCYQAADVFFEPATYWFERAFKLVYALSFAGLLFAAAYAARARLANFRSGWFGVASVLIFCSFSVGSWCACQPEHSAAMVAMAITLLLLGQGRFTLFAAAALAGTCFFFKAVTLSFAVQAPLLAVLCGESVRSRRLIAYCLLATFAFFALLTLTVIFARSEIVDLFNGAKVLGIFDRPWSEKVRLALQGLPFSWVQLLAFPMCILVTVLRPPTQRIFLLSLPVLVTALVPVLVQGAGYAYHQLNFLPLASCIFAVGLLRPWAEPAKVPARRLALALVVCVSPQLLSYPLMGKFRFLSHFEHSRLAKVPPKWSARVSSIQEKMDGERALFGTWGDVPYLLQIKPSQKYFTFHYFGGLQLNLHERSGDFHDFHEHWLNYDGPLIVAAIQLKQLDRYPEIFQKVWSEYELFHQEEFHRYSAFKAPAKYYFLRRKDGGPFTEMGPKIPLE